jgi:murein DD-endopeptidase MepM/ murein hydrolase activator NlpD
MSQAQYGIDVQSREVLQSHLEDKQFVTDVLRLHGVTSTVIDELEEQAKDVLDVRRMRSGRPYTLIKDLETQSVEYFIYEKTDADYVVFDLRDGVEVYEGQKKVRIRQREVGSLVIGSLYQSVEAAQIDLRLVKMIESVFAYTVDFFQLDHGDYFKVIYEEELVDEIPIGIRRIVAAQVRQRGVDYYAFYFEQDSSYDYFDRQGRSLKRTFLQSPLEASALTDRALRDPRFHTRRGMDYFVPEGTPVVSVGDGVVIDLGSNYERGHYVTIRHNGLYTTQYEFMRELTDSLAIGSKVRQGHIIGAVGRRYDRRRAMLRFRFRQSGEVIDPREVRIPDSESILPQNRHQFERYQQMMLRRLEQTTLQQPVASAGLMAVE